MATYTIKVDDIDQTAEYFADTEGMSIHDKEDALDTVCAYLTRTTGHDVDWEYGTDMPWLDIEDAQRVREEIDLAIENMVNASWYSGPASLQ